MGLKDRLLAAWKAFRFGDRSMGQTQSWLWLPGAGEDDRIRAGQTWKNSIVAACLNWAARTFPESPFVVYREGEIVPDHPLTRLIRRPNPFYTGRTLWQATLMSLMISGNAYWFKVRSAAQRVVQLYWRPHWVVRPRWDSTESYIDWYEYQVDGESWRIPVQDVVHFRYGIDPENERLGLSPLASVLREIVTDNEAATFSKAILINMGVPGVMIAPKSQEMVIASDQAERLKRLWKERFTGEHRGEPLVQSVPVEVTQVGVSPRELMIDTLRRLPEERICAALGIPPAVVMLGAGLDRSIYNNIQQAREEAYEGFIIPMQRVLADTIDTQLLPELGDPDREQSGFDLLQVRVLQEDVDTLAKRMDIGVRNGSVTVAEFRRALGLPTTDEDEIYLRPPQLVPIPKGGSAKGWFIPEEGEDEWSLIGNGRS